MLARIGYYIFVLPLSHLPLGILYLFTDFLYLILVTTGIYRKSTIEENIQRSFPNLSPKERKKIKRKFYRHFTDLLAEGIKNLSISEKELKKRFKVVNPELMQELYDRKRNVLLVSGHYNNWEWLITAQNFLFPHKAIGIGMPLSSKFWDKQINSRRERYGMKVVNAKNYKQELKSNPETLKAVLVLSDQSPGDALKSYWMDFLNQSTPVLFGAEMMAHDLDYSVVFFATRKIKRGYYKMELSLVAEKPSNTSWGQITESHTTKLEKEIIDQPAYWLWSHKRWKRQQPENLTELKKKQNENFNKRFNL
ncbi:MAG: KDO2-lipid IV(A) lauroyltransferase [Crocinitomicaceae bacterium]|jgi:KDO2-lipid IV(A) lauroyltransferase